MARFKMEDGTVIDTANASQSWEGATDHDGQNAYDVHTGDQWSSEVLFRSRKGRYYKVCSSRWQGSRDHAEWLDEREAARWLILNGDELPEGLAHLQEEITE